MEDLGLNLTLFLDSVSWGDPKCISNPMIRNARTGLMTSTELPSILRRWWRPPRVQGSSHSRPSGASRVMEDFAHECISHIVNKEIESIAQVFESGGDDDVSEERLTNTTFPAAIEQVKSQGSLVWSLLSDFACVQVHGHQDLRTKKLDTVCKLFWGLIFHFSFFISSKSRSFSSSFRCCHIHATIGADASRNYSVFTSNFVVLLQKDLTCCMPLR